MIKKQLPFIISICSLTVAGLVWAEPYYQNNQSSQRYQNNPGNSGFYNGNQNAPVSNFSGQGGYQTGSMQTQQPGTQANQNQSMGYQGAPVFQQGMMHQPAIPNSRIDPVYSVRALPMNSTVKLGGTVIPFRDVTLAAQIPGRVEFISGSEGDFMEEGQVLVTIDDDDLLAKRRSALAELNNAESAIRNAQVQYSRELISPQSKNINRSPGMGMPSMFDQFFTRGMGNQMGYGNPGMDRHADLYSRATAVNQAQARQLRSRSQLEQVDAQLRDTRAIAPFSGLIVKKLVEVGDTVQPGQAMLKFADTKVLQLKVDIPARLMPGIQPGMIVDARLDVGDKHIRAKVAQIFPMADVQRHTVTVKFDLPEGIPGGPGMYAEVVVPNVSVAARNVIIVPTTAIRQRGSLNVVYRLNEKNKVEIRYVRLGEAINENMVAVLSGLQDNDRILSNPPGNIQSGWSFDQTGLKPAKN